jgi:hypothetical protein
VSTQGSAAGGRRPDLLTRFQAALPLLALYFGLAALYAWQASRHPVPTIFTDELELTQLSRSIAETGEAARRGDPYGLATLVAYVLAPVWWLSTASSAYAAGKLVLVLAMTATVFPAYGLARLVVPRWYAIGAAGAAVAVPALAYSTILVEEPLAYPLSTLALWLIARTLVRPSWWRLVAALAASAAAALTRTQLAALFAVLALGLLWLGWQSGPMRRWRAQWSRWDWVGAGTLAVGAVLAFSSAMGHRSVTWRQATYFYKDRIVDHASWSVGALAIGIGVLPLLIGAAALVRPKTERHDPQTRAFVVTSAAAIGVFVWYAGVKGAYVSTVFATYIYERNVFYLVPVLFAATALAFARGVGRIWAIAAAAIATLLVVNATPIELQYPYYEAHGLAILAFANRELGWSAERIDDTLVVVSLAAIAVVVALGLLRRGSLAFGALAGAAAVAVVAWSLTAEVYAAEGERILSKQFAANLPKPYDWVDRATDGRSVVVLGQQMADPTNVWLTEFFNPSIRGMWSLDATAPGPGPIQTPDLDATDGTLYPTPGTEYALALNGVELQAPAVLRRGRDTLYRLDGRPLQLASAVTGLYSDGWMADRAGYTRYDVSRDGPGFARVRLSRERWCGRDKPGRATVRIGPAGIGEDKQPAIAEVTEVKGAVLHACQARTLLLAAPRVPWRVEVTMEPTFSPNELDPSKSDRRQLGAVLDVGFQPLFGG